MISLTLRTALGVRLIGGFFVSAGFTSGVVVVAISISLKVLPIIITKPVSSTARKFAGWLDDLTSHSFDDPDRAHVARKNGPPDYCQQVYNSALGPYPSAGCGATTDILQQAFGNGSKSVPRWFMTPGLVWLLIAWGVLTAILIVLLIYRSTLTMQEDDQLFLDESASAMAEEQRQLMAKVNKINPLVKLLGATSGVMILVIAGWAVYIGLNAVQP